MQRHQPEELQRHLPGELQPLLPVELQPLLPLAALHGMYLTMSTQRFCGAEELQL